MSRPITKFGFFFSLIGLIILYLGISFTTTTKSFIINSKKINATLVRYEMSSSNDSSTVMYRPVFSYMIDGEKIETAANRSSSSREHRKGTTIEILVSKENPYKMKENSFRSLWVLPIICFTLASLLCLVGFGILIHVYRSSIKAKKLIVSGFAVRAPIIDMIEDQTIEINGIHPLKAIVECKDAGGILRRCKSHSSMEIGPHMIGKKLIVYFDRDNHNKYFVDLDTIENYGKKVAA